jgi:hypothetical protein
MSRSQALFALERIPCCRTIHSSTDPISTSLLQWAPRKFVDRVAEGGRLLANFPLDCYKFALPTGASTLPRDFLNDVGDRYRCHREFGTEQWCFLLGIVGTEQSHGVPEVPCGTRLLTLFSLFF